MGRAYYLAMVRSFTFLPLFREPFGAQAAKDLQKGLRPTPSAPVTILVAPVRQLAFFAHSSPQAAELDIWWAREVEPGSLPVILMLHEDGLPQWLAGTDAEYWIGAPAALHPLYVGLSNVHLLASEDPEAVVEFAMQSMLADPGLFSADQTWKTWHLATPPPVPSRENPDLTLREPRFDAEPSSADVASVLSADEEAHGETSGELNIDQKALDQVLANISASKPADADDLPFYKRPASKTSADTDVSGNEDYVAVAAKAGPERRGGPTRRPSAVRPEAPELQTESTMDPGSIIDPFSLIANAPPTNYMPPAIAPSKITHAPTKEEEAHSKAPKKGLMDQFSSLLKSSNKKRLVDVPAATGRTVTDLKPLIISVASRKGGVGKTASAGAIAILLAEAVDQFGGWQAALVDANIVNPDSWGLHDLSEDAPTLRQVIAAIMRGAVPPDPIYAKIPAPLAIYPESRDAGAGYDSGQITRLVEYLKGRFAAIVFDLPNTMPDLESPAGRMAVNIIAVSDVVVLPTLADKAAFQGVFDYLGAPVMRNRPTVVAYIVPRDKLTREHAGVRQSLERVDSLASKRVDIAEDDGATRALWTGQAITTISPQLRSDYIGLVNAIVNTARAGRM